MIFARHVKVGFAAEAEVRGCRGLFLRRGSLQRVRERMEVAHLVKVWFVAGTEAVGRRHAVAGQPAC